MTLSCDRDRGDGTGGSIRAMEYPVVRGLPGPDGACLPEDETGPDAKAGLQEEALARQLEAVRREAIEQGRKTAVAESSAWRQQRAAELARATEAFHTSRDAYLAQVEKEVVQLALAVAEKILRRESRLDPLLLSGAVRKALGQVAEATQVRLRVPAEQRELWTDVVRLMPGLPLRPEVVADSALANRTVVLESSLGTVDLGLEAQLQEIERGFFDRVEHRGEEDRARPNEETLPDGMK